MKKTQIKFLKNCSTVKSSYKAGDVVEIEIENKMPKDISLNEIFLTNDIKNYFEIINIKKSKK